MGGQPFVTDGVLIDIRKLHKVLCFDTERGRIEIESGMQWMQLYDYLLSSQRGGRKAWTFAQKPVAADHLTMGGSLSANIRGRLAAHLQFEDFLKLKRKYDPGELFQSDWYRHLKTMFFR